MKKEMVRNVAGVIIFYLVLVLGVIAINARMEGITDTNRVVSLTN